MSALKLRSTRSVNDATLGAIVTAFPKLSELSVAASKELVTVAGLAHLTKLRQLHGLWLRGDAVDDAALAQIAKCDSLTGLEISNSRVTEAGVPVLARLGSLREVTWPNPPMSDAALKTYPKLRALTTFMIGPKTRPRPNKSSKPRCRR